MDTSKITIWTFIGGLLFIYGVMILGASVAELGSNTPPTVVLPELHAGIWWGAILIAIGAVYLWRDLK